MTELLEWVSFFFAALFILAGVVFTAITTIGVNRFHYVLNRMQAAAMGDTLGIFFIFLGLIVLNGFQFSSLKYLLVILFFWFAGPVSSHLIARLEVTTNPEEVEKECEVQK